MANVYKNKRAELTIEQVGGGSLGRCYSFTQYKVTTKSPLTDVQITTLRESGFLGYGQEFYVLTPKEARESPAGRDILECVDSDTGKPALDPRTNKPYNSIKVNYYECLFERRVDSSD